MRRRLLSFVTALCAGALLAAGGALAQAPTKPKPKPAPQPAPQAAPQAPAPAPQPAQAPAAAAPAMPQFVATPWVKLCETQPNKICVTRALLRTDAGQPAALAEFAQPDGQPTILRVTLPLGMLLQYGTRLHVDQEGAQPLATGNFVVCLEGCITFYQVSAELQERMKKGKTLIIQAVNLNNQAMSFPLPLTSFAKALDGPPTDPKIFQEEQKKLQEELQKKARELQQRQGAPAAAPK
jgi:invasion protein IalB